MMVLVDVFGGYFPCAIDMGAWFHQEERLGTARTSAGKGCVVQFIAHHLRIALHADDDLCLIGQHRAVHILHHAADSVDQRGVVGVCMVDVHMTLAHNLQRLTDSVFAAKEAMGQPLCDDALVGCVEGRPAVTLHQWEIKELEERRVGQHDDAVLIVGILHLFITILDTAPLTHHAAGLLHIGTQPARCSRL